MLQLSSIFSHNVPKVVKNSFDNLAFTAVSMVLAIMPYRLYISISTQEECTCENLKLHIEYSSHLNVICYMRRMDTKLSS